MKKNNNKTIPLILASILLLTFLGLATNTEASITGMVTNTQQQGEPVTITNDAEHGTPDLYETINYNTVIPSGTQLHENTEYTFYIYSEENPTGVELEYRLIDDAQEMCEVIDSTSGEINCLPTHEIIAGTSQPANKTPLNYTIEIQARDNTGSEPTSTTRLKRFELVPGNNQAVFNQTINDTTIEAGIEWRPNIQAQDLEFDYPLTYEITGSLTDEHPGILSVIGLNTDNASVELRVNEDGNAFTNAQQGNWTVNISVEDTIGSNETRPATTQTFNLEVLGSNFPPQITSDQTSLEGTQYEEFFANITAEDPNINDTVTFTLTEPSNASFICPVEFPWNITTVNNNATHARGVIEENLSINHVICRYANLTVQDQDGLKDSEIVFFNITNINDPPTIHRFSQDGDIENQTGYLFVNGKYQVNASDPDELTYNADEFANLSYTVNDSRFTVDDEGLIEYFFTEQEELGRYLVNVTVTDGQFNDTKVLDINISNNAPPQLFFENIQENYTQYEDITFEIRGYDAGGTDFTKEVENVSRYSLDIYNITLISDVTNSTGRHKTWLVNMTKDESQPSQRLKAIRQVGEHILDIRLTDDFGSSTDISRDEISFVIQNENDAPFFDVNQNNFSSSTNQIRDYIGNIVFDREVNVIISATDYDVFVTPEFADENLEFFANTTLSGAQSFSFEKINDTQARLSFLPTQLGSGNITLGVRDSQGVEDVRVLDVDVIEQTVPPEILLIRPYNDDGDVVDGFRSAGNFEFNAEDLYFSENTTLRFDATADFDESLPNNTVTYSWYVNDVLMQEEENLDGSSSRFDYYFDFFSSNQTQEVLLVVEDEAFSTDEFLWRNNLQNVNRKPLFIGPMEDLQVDSTEQFGNYLSRRFNSEIGVTTQRFYDPDDDPSNKDSTEFVSGVSQSNLDITLQGGCASTGVADFEIIGDDLRVIPRVVGQCVAVFNATDEHGASVLSDEVTIEVTDVEDETPQESSGGGGATTPRPIPIEQEVETPEPFNLVIPDTATTYVGRSIEVPISIENTWDDDVEGIDLRSVALNATFSEEDAEFSFGRSSIPRLGVGDVVNTTLTVTNFRALGPYEIRINATSRNPEFEDSATILINSLEMVQDSSAEAVESRVTFARELLSDNVECQELNELLNRAQNSLSQGDNDEAFRMVDAAINGCRHIMGQDVRRDTPSALTTGMVTLDMYGEQFLVGIGLLTLLSLIVLGGYLFRERLKKQI